MQARNINIDIVKVIAAFSVVCVHFFHNTGFYSIELHGVWGLIATGLRTLFMVCVPLFLLTTGYLMKNKSISRHYYFGLAKVMIAYVLLCAVSLAWRIIYHGEAISLLGCIRRVLDYSACSYTWYVQMYIGLYLLIPFLNVLYKGLKGRKRRLALIAVLLLIVSVPLSINHFFSIFPSWWSNSLFPLLFYYLGAYIKDYFSIKDGRPLTSEKLLIFFVAWVFGCSVFNYMVAINSRGNLFGGDGYTDWGGVENVVSSTLLFLLIIGLRFDLTCENWVKRVIIAISSSSFAMYLSSGIIDKTVYPVLLNAFGGFLELFPFFVPITFFVIVCSLILAIPITNISGRIASFLELRLRRS